MEVAVPKAALQVAKSVAMCADCHFCLLGNCMLAWAVDANHASLALPLSRPKCLVCGACTTKATALLWHPDCPHVSSAQCTVYSNHSAQILVYSLVKSCCIGLLVLPCFLLCVMTDFALRLWLQSMVYSIDGLLIPIISLQGL